MRKGKREYLIKWKGWSAKDNTWEPKGHLNPKVICVPIEQHLPQAPRPKPTTCAETLVFLPQDVKDFEDERAGNMEETSGDESEEDEEVRVPAPTPSVPRPHLLHHQWRHQMARRLLRVPVRSERNLAL